MQEASKKSRRMPSIIRGRHEKPVPTLDSGLVDLDPLETYLHRNTLHVPLYPTSGWKYHHINHPKSSFKQQDAPTEDRDSRLWALRSSPYQQLHMRVSNEIIYHNVHDIYVPHPAAETVDKALRDFERIDMLGAACLFLSLSRGNRQYGIDPGSINPSWAQELSMRDRINFISEIREDHARSLVSAEVIPSRLVSSVIKRLSMHLKDPYLTSYADQRLASDPVFYPVKVPSHKNLLNKANRLIALEFLGTETPRSALQTEVGEVKLAA